MTAYPRHGRPASLPARPTARDDASMTARDDAAMLVLELAMATVALASALLLALAR